MSVKTPAVDRDVLARDELRFIGRGKNEECAKERSWAEMTALFDEVF